MTYETKYRSLYELSTAAPSIDYVPRHESPAIEYAMPYRAAQQRGVPSDERVTRFTPDILLGGFWKERGSSAEFIAFASLEGQKLLRAWDLLGMPVRTRPR